MRRQFCCFAVTARLGVWLSVLPVGAPLGFLRPSGAPAGQLARPAGRLRSVSCLPAGR
ncbi:hypothetical protein XFF6166_460007 [Xanthomonas citri pv. fuscans]|nr:hypothetical protein XFF6166_460007 [Xanthomonas citri pv. fuscans]SOO02734.1 hypothetical protein XFF6960_70007 [Xanthomonas citri pv. fuscans]SOO04755.1 hypothetical protein XFF7767_300007 [Xanthomonas citri pv. fuscans]SOO09377.1 hypothetical protein XFF6970_350007 [Xanthomonas citri pv. fuscans]SOO13527.1 hypothetical protein XFF7766_190007 [Xanthomonas citri pv. fuscans]